MSKLLPLSQFEDIPNNPTKIKNIIKNMIRRDERFRRKYTNINGMVDFKVLVEMGSDINAYAFKEDGQEYLVFTEGCLRKLNEKQFQAIVAHEMAHHLKSDYTYAGFRSLFVFCILLAISIYVSYFLSLLINAYFNLSIGSLQVGSLLGFIVFLSGTLITTYATAKVYWHFFQKCEFRADKISAEIFGYPSMISALESLESPNRKQTRLEDFLSQFASHPPLSERIKVLKELRDKEKIAS